MKFAIVRAYQSGGHVDPNAKATIQAALDAGVSHVDAYLFPDVHGDPAAQVRDTHSALSGVRYGMIWYDIERLSWSSSQATNQDFIKKLVDEGKSLGVHAGIYTNYYNWQVRNLQPPTNADDCASARPHCVLLPLSCDVIIVGHCRTRLGLPSQGGLAAVVRALRQQPVVQRLQGVRRLDFAQHQAIRW